MFAGIDTLWCVAAQARDEEVFLAREWLFGDSSTAKTMRISLAWARMLWGI